MSDSSAGRLGAVLFSPRRTFESIAARPTWALALIVLVVLSLVLTTFIFQRIDMGDAIRDQMAKQGKQLSDEEIAKFSGIQEKVGMGCAILAPPVGYLVTALLFMVAFNLVGGEIKFPASLSVTLHALMPWAVATLLSIPVVLSKTTLDLDSLQSRGLLASNLAAVAPADAGKPLLALLSSFDLFSVWTVVLLIIGYQVVAKVPKRTAVATVLALWAVYIVGKVGLAAVGSAFGGA